MASTIYDIIIRAVDNAKSTLNGTGQQLDKLDKQTTKVNDNLSKLGTGVTRFAQAGAVALGALTGRAIRLADAISDTSDATQISIQTILGLSKVVEGSKVNFDDISNALLRFNENLGTAASSGGKSLREALGKVGISVQDLANLGNEDILLKVLDNLSKMEDQSTAASLATDIFGRSLRGAPLGKFGDDLRRAITEQKAQAQSVKDAADAADSLEAALGQVSRALLIAIQPATKFIASLGPDEFNKITTAVLAFGAALVAAFAASTIANIYAAITAVGALIGVLRGAAIAAVTFLATTGPAGWAAVAAGVVAAGGAIYGLNKLLDQNIDKSGKAADAASGIGGGDTGKGDKPKGPARNVEKLKSDVVKVRSVVATAAEAFKEANNAYDELIDTFDQTLDLSLKALQFKELTSAAETLGIVVQKPTDLIGRDFSLALRKSGEELRINAEQLKMTASMQIKFAQEITSANQALEERRLKLADATYQQGLFTNAIAGNRLTQQEQISTLAQADAALAAGTISLNEYAKVASGVAPELLSLTQKQKLLKDEFDTELKVQKDTDLLAIYRLELARASGDVRAFVDAYSQYKSIFGATAEGELALALKGARDDIKLTDARKAAYGDLSEQLKTGAISAREFRAAASNLGIDEGAANRVAAIYGSAADQIVTYNEMLEKSIEKLSNKFEDDLTSSIMAGKNLFSSFKDFVGGILNDIASQIIKQQIASPLANALGGLAKGLGESIFSKVAAPGGGTGSAFGALGNLFAGFFAQGGTIGAGKIGIVGENGPEFVSGPSTVTPMNEMAGMPGDTFHVNFNISAIDTQSGAEFIMRNKPIITGVIEQAYNKRGRRGPVTVG